MRIAQVATVNTPVRRIGAGSIESMVWLLTRELVALGHDVTVFCAHGSNTPGRTVCTVPTCASEGAPDWHICEWINLAAAVERSREFDVIHSHAYLWGVPLQPLSAAPLVHTLHVMPDGDAGALRRLHPTVPVVGISAYQWAAFPSAPPAAVIHHAVDGEAFSYSEEPDDYVCFVGRFTPGKGPERALEIARAAGVRLLLAGPRNAHFDRTVAPHVDGARVAYLGPIGGAERNRLLGRARALLYPLAEPEPFGLVPVEAMMCGTPVVATDLGAVPDIVRQGVTGFYAPGADALPALLPRSFQLDRRVVREEAVRRFSPSRMAQQHLDLYEHVVSGRPATAGVL
jgi:glycosyltransferase involved in cell wall biosynthesis